MELSKRLQAVAGMVSAGNRLVDVGTDHGYIPIYLTERKKIPSAIAMDVRTGPLSRAEEHIRQAGLTTYITCRLSNGLERLSPGEGDSLLLAGMGGNLMVRILTERPEIRDSFRELILQPQSAQYLVRKTMDEAGWCVDREAMVLEDGKFYPMLRLVPGWGTGRDRGKGLENTRDYICGTDYESEPDCKNGMDNENGAGYKNEAEYTYGKLLLRERNPVLKEYLDRQKNLFGALTARLRQQPKEDRSESARARLYELEKEMAVLEEALGYYNSYTFIEEGRKEKQ